MRRPVVDAVVAVLTEDAVLAGVLEGQQAGLGQPLLQLRGVRVDGAWIAVGGDDQGRFRVRDLGAGVSNASRNRPRSAPGSTGPLVAFSNVCTKVV
jgi:hypothetical protein